MVAYHVDADAVCCVYRQDDIYITQEIDMTIDDRLDSRLDLALELTFPASDPISVYIPEVDRFRRRAAEAKDQEVAQQDQKSAGLRRPRTAPAPSANRKP